MRQVGFSIGSRNEMIQKGVLQWKSDGAFFFLCLLEGCFDGPTSILRPTHPTSVRRDSIFLLVFSFLPNKNAMREKDEDKEYMNIMLYAGLIVRIKPKKYVGIKYVRTHFCALV